MTEQELVARARSGDQRAFEQLMLDNEKRVYNLALRMTGSPEDAMDLSQEAFLSAWRGLKFFKGDSAFSTWLYRLTSNACIDHLRRQKRRQSVSLVVSLEDEQERQTEIPDCRFLPEEELQRREQRRALERGLSQLSAERRQVLVLRELEGLSYQEIGDLLELEAGTVKSRIARARNALREILLKDGNFFDGAPSKQTNKPGEE